MNGKSTKNMNAIDLKQFNHRLNLQVRFMDLDALQHVNNARYLNFLEEARIAYCQEKLDLFNNITDLNVLVARIEIDFAKPIHFGDQLSIHTRVSKIGGKSFTFESVFCVEKNGVQSIVSRAIQVLVTFDIKSGRSIEVPQDIKQKIKSIENLEG